MSPQESPHRLLLIYEPSYVSGPAPAMPLTKCPRIDPIRHPSLPLAAALDFTGREAATVTLESVVGARSLLEPYLQPAYIYTLPLLLDKNEVRWALGG